MRLDLYQAETEQIARKQTQLLDEVRLLLASNKVLSDLEKNGVLHALQILIENAIGKAKHLLKANKIPVPVSAYDAFSELVKLDYLTEQELVAWNSAIGLRNMIVHDYMNIDIARILELVQLGNYQNISRFLLMPINLNSSDV